MLTAMVLASSCSFDESPRQFDLVLEFASEHGGPRVCTQSCSAYPLACPGRFGVRIADGRDPNEEYDFRCVDAPAGASTLCSLSEIELEFKPLPLTTARVEIALWREDVLEEGRCLRGPIFDLHGEPLVTIQPPPAVAGAAYFVVGAQSRVVVPMACPFPDQMSAEMCPDRGSD